jgi:MoaA/NifB/PqqE/SkfB family radical SAM enzyme
LTPNSVRSIELGITNKCTLRCPHCLSLVYKKPEQEPIHLELSALLNFLDKLPSLETVLIEGSYSDQLMYPQLLDVIFYCKNRKLKIRFCTHGSARNETWWKKLAELLNENDIVRFAIDGSTQELHEKYRVNSKLEKVLHNHSILKKNSKVKTSLQHIVFEYNKHDTENIISLSKRENFDRCEIIQCGNVIINENLKKERIIPVKELLKYYEKNNKILADIKFSNNYTCDSLIRDEIYINYRGEVVLCADHDNEVIKPNIFNSSLEDIFDHINKSTDRNICFKNCNTLDYNVGKKFPIKIYSEKIQTVQFHTRELK